MTRSRNRGRQRAGPERPKPPRAVQAPRTTALSTRVSDQVPADAMELVATKLSGFADITWDWRQIQAFTVETIHDVITRRNIAPEDLTEPRLDITVPAIEAMRYSPLKREMATLIASTMDITCAHNAHPAFIEILKQVTSDEINLIAAFPAPGQVVPMASINYVDRGDQVHLSTRHIVPNRFASVCDETKGIASYIDNLLRLNLISSPHYLSIRDDRYYREILSQAFIADFEGRIPLHLKARVDRSVLSLTDFGATFRQCCIDETTLIA